MKKLLIMLLVICTALPILGGFGTVAEELDYSKIGFKTLRTGNQVEYPKNAEQFEELVTYITSYQVDPASYGFHVSIKTTTEEIELTKLYRYGEPDLGRLLEDLTESVTDKTVLHVLVQHGSLPQDDEPPASETGDSAVYGVAVLGVAAAALTILLLRKKKI